MFNWFAGPRVNRLQTSGQRENATPVKMHYSHCQHNAQGLAWVKFDLIISELLIYTWTASLRLASVSTDWVDSAVHAIATTVYRYRIDTMATASALWTPLKTQSHTNLASKLEPQSLSKNRIIFIGRFFSSVILDSDILIPVRNTNCTTIE